MPKSPYFKKTKEIIKKSFNKNIDQDILNKQLPDYLDYDLKVLFVGINPGITSALRGHHFAGPTNHFWGCLSESGLVDRPLTYKDDSILTTQYKLGMTNLSHRTTRQQSDLTMDEQKQNIPLLTEKIATYRPKIACFIGKGIYEIYAKKKITSLGLQPTNDAIPWKLDNDNRKSGHTLIFVMPSTSGRVSAYHKSDKLKFFKQLCSVVNQQCNNLEK
ncbi:unnamed protein product [Cunninghamella echinulata]